MGLLLRKVRNAIRKNHESNPTEQRHPFITQTVSTDSSPTEHREDCHVGMLQLTLRRTSSRPLEDGFQEIEFGFNRQGQVILSVVLASPDRHAGT